MNESRWKGASSAAYAETGTEFEGEKCTAGLVLLSTDSPVYAGHGADRIKIVDEGFLWLQLAPEGGFWWLTAMYNEKAELIQFYFDVTFGNMLKKDGESCFTDAFADVVITPGLAPRVLDRDELEAAVKEGLLSEAEAEDVLAKAEYLASRFADCRALSEKCDELLKLLMKKL